MNRPKRTKLALSTSAAPMRVSNSKQKNPRQLELSATTSSDRAQNNSDDSEGLVTTRKIKAGKRRGIAAQEAIMSGALAPGDPAPVRSRPLGGRKRHLRSKIGRDVDDDKAIEALKVRRDAALAAERGGHLPIESEKSPVRGRAAVREEEQNPSADVATKRIVQATPRVAQSILEASNFKRRPRQPSLLRLIQAQADHQSEDEEDDLDDFQPDDESTPFLKSKPQSGLYISPSPPPPVQSAPTSSSRKRKRTSPEVQISMSQPDATVLTSPPSRSLSLEPEPEGEEKEEEEEEVHTIPSSNPDPNPEPPLPSPLQQPTNSPPPIPDSDTLAPPLSSSPAPSPSPEQATSNPIRGNPPSSPSHPPSRKPAASRALKPLSTASLQNMLPRRRPRFNLPQHGDAFDLPDSSDLEIDTSRLGEDEDELNVHAKVRVKGRNRDQRPDTGAWVAGTGKGKKKPPQQQKEKEKEKEKATMRKTYVRQTARAAAASANEKDDEIENQEEDDDDDSRLAGAPSARAKLGGRGTKAGATASELKRQAIKFREVDEWKLDIEDMTGSGSSQLDAR